MKDFIQILAKFYVEGGIFMHPITFLMVFGWAVALERTYVLFKRYNLDARKYYNFIEQKVTGGDVAGALKASYNVPLSNIVTFGLEKVKSVLHQEAAATVAGVTPNFEKRHALIFEKGVEEIAALEFPKIERRLSMLPMLANLATLLGLLGTLQGLIQSFASLTNNVDPAMKSQMLAKGIATAMNTTAYGLFAAITILFCYAILNSRAERLAQETEHYVIKFINLITQRF